MRINVKIYTIKIIFKKLQIFFNNYNYLKKTQIWDDNYQVQGFIPIVSIFGCVQIG